MDQFGNKAWHGKKRGLVGALVRSGPRADASPESGCVVFPTPHQQRSFECSPGDPGEQATLVPP